MKTVGKQLENNRKTIGKQSEHHREAIEKQKENHRKTKEIDMKMDTRDTSRLGLL